MIPKDSTDNEWHLFRQIAKPYSLEIMESLYDKKKRFSDLKAACPHEVTRTRRLLDLRDLGLVRRMIKDTRKRVVVYYVLTKKGRETLENGLNLKNI